MVAGCGGKSDRRTLDGLIRDSPVILVATIHSIMTAWVYIRTSDAIQPELIAVQEQQYLFMVRHYVGYRIIVSVNTDDS